MSGYPLHLRSPIVLKTDNQYDRESGALREYSEFDKTIVGSGRFCKTVIAENMCLHHHFEVGCKGFLKLFHATVIF